MKSNYGLMSGWRKPAWLRRFPERLLLIRIGALVCALGLILPRGAAQEIAAERLMSRSARRASLLAEAERASAGGPGGADARFTEARNRLAAALLSDDPVPDSDLALARVARNDARLPAEKRLELAVLEDQGHRKGQRFASKEAYWLEREKSARRMMAEFPELSAPLSQLLAVAEGAPTETGLRLAREIMAIAAAPTIIKSRAQDVIVRGSLDGRALEAMLSEVPGAAGLLQRSAGKGVVFYTWSPKDVGSIARAKELGSRIPNGTLVLGINLDLDVAAALSISAEQGLPGEQLYGARGFDSPLVRALALTKPGLIYAASAGGELRNFSDAREATAMVDFLK